MNANGYRPTVQRAVVTVSIDDSAVTEMATDSILPYSPHRGF